MRKFSLFFILLIGITSCFDAPEFSDIPVITGVRLEGGEGNIFTVADLAYLVVDFEDGDGDLGEFIADTLGGDLLITNTDNVAEIRRLGIPRLPRSGSVPDISGTVRWNIQRPGEETTLISEKCLSTFRGKIDTLIFSLQIRDREGNLSNIEFSPEIIIDCR